MDAQQEKLKEELLKILETSLDDISVSTSGNTKTYEFKVEGAQLKSFKKDFVMLKLKTDNTQSEPKKEEKKEQPSQPIAQAKPITPITQPKKQPEPEPKPEQPPKLKSKTSSNKSNKLNKSNKKSEPKSSPNFNSKISLDTDPPRERSPSPIAPAQSLEARSGAIGAIVPEAKVPDDKPKLENRSSSNKKPKLRKSSSAKKLGASKAVFGSLKSGIEKRLHLGRKDTFNGCEYIPQFKGSERGCILKKTNKELQKRGIVKKSQIDKFNGVEISGESLKKIKKMIKDYKKLNKPYTIQFEIPEIDLDTIELTFTGVFCPGIEFTKEYDGNNMIVKSIDKTNDSNKYLINKAELKVGYRIFKVKGSNVLNKSFKEIKSVLDKAGSDIRVSYQVVFIQGNIDWFNFENPNVYNNDDEKKIDLPTMKSNKSGSSKSPRKTSSPRKSPRKSPINTPLTPSTPSAKDPKYYLRDKKNIKCYFDIRIDGDKRGRIEIILFMGIVPKTATNFLKLCTGDNKKKLSYKGKKFYKMYVGMGIEGGDVESNNGSGKSSIYGGYFDDENFKIRHKQYCLSMKNEDEPNTNASQFYIIVSEDADYLDGKNVVFGFIADKDSQSLVDDMEEEGCSLTGKPKCKCVISKCGKLKK